MAERRALIAEDSVLFRRGVREVLIEGGWRVEGETDNADDLMTMIDEQEVAGRPVDLAVVDVKMPPGYSDEGIRAVEAIRSSHPRVAVLVLSMYSDPSYAMRCLAAGTDGVGYLLKDRVVDITSFLEAAERVVGGGSALDPTVVDELVQRRQDHPRDRLTEREQVVLGLMAEGRSNRAIAEHLGLTDKTVETHITRIFSKLDLPVVSDDHRRVRAVLAWLDAGRR